MKLFKWTLETLEQADQLQAFFTQALEFTTGKRYQDSSREQRHGDGGYTLTLPGMTWSFGPPCKPLDPQLPEQSSFTVGQVVPETPAMELWLMINLPACAIPEEMEDSCLPPN